MQGPASMNVESAWSATLKSGKVRANLPPEAMGFSISNPSVEVVDLGTEFTMFADTSGASTDVLVLKGEVEASPNGPTDQQPILLKANESRRFAASGVSPAHDSKQKFSQLIVPPKLDHFVAPSGYAHWSFDQPTDGSFHVENVGLASEASEAVMVGTPAGMVGSPTVVKGPWSNAIHFDGHSYAKAAFPGISENLPHTVLFWVRVPKDAPLSTAYAMVAWGINNPKMGSHPIQICWNHSPGDGPVGALRTDYGGGFAMGATSLRDGHWHHVGVVFTPAETAPSYFQVKQYVDGRLEGEGKPSPSGSDAFAYSGEGRGETTKGTLWLGCRLGIQRVTTYRFLGDLDELFVADRALEPQEIISAMTTDQLSF